MSSGSYEVLFTGVIPLFKRLRSFLQKPEDSPPRTIALGDVALMLDEREQTMDLELRGIIAPHREVILDTLKRIRKILDQMGSKERDPAWNPKLEKIGKTALPNFIRSMEQVLDRSLSPTPSVEFYQEAASVLKSCIGAMKGAGKYLPMIFPDEMKALRHEIRTLGQAINAITAELTSREQERARIHKLHLECTALTTELSHLNDVQLKHDKIKGQSADAELRIATLRKTIEDIKGGTDFGILEGYHEQLRNLEREAREIHLKNEGILGVFLTIYRRAEKIAYRNNDPGRAVLEEAIRALGSTTSTYDQLGEVLERSLPLVMRLMEAGDLPLKGHEEIRIFGPGSSPLQEALHALREIAYIDQKMTETRDQLAALPLLKQIQHLEQDCTTAEELRDKYRRELHQIDDHLNAIPKRIRTHRDKVDQMLSEVSHGKVQLPKENDAVEKG